jgi:hypothetical protein
MNATKAHPLHSSRFLTRGFGVAVLLNAIWINASEIFRYFIFIMPMMREAFPQVPNIAPMDPFVFAIWGVWDMLLIVLATGFMRLWFERFGHGTAMMLGAATLYWLGSFVFFWAAAYNMGFATFQIVCIALPLSWLELTIAAWIVRWSTARYG